MADTLLLSELIYRMQSRNRHLPPKVVEAAVRRVFIEIAEAMASGDRVELRGFGSFDVREREPTTRTNPRTGGPLQLGERRNIYWRTGKLLTERLNQPETS